MSFKTKSIISRILITVLFPSLSAFVLLMILSYFNLNNVIKIIICSIIWLSFAVACVLFFTKSDGAEYNDKGIILYRPCVGEDFIPWETVKTVELRYIPKNGKNVFVYTDKYSNSYRPHDDFLSVFVVKNNDPIVLPYKEKLVDIINAKCSNAEIKRLF